MKFQLPEQPSNATLNENYYLDYLQRLYRHIKGDDDWIAPSLQNSWVNYGAGYPEAEYRLKNGIVYIQGLIKNGTTTSGTTIFTLPVKYRPNTTLFISTTTNNAGTRQHAMLAVQNDGAVKIYDTYSTWVSLQCSFIAEQ